MNGWTNFETWRVALEVFDTWEGDYLSPEEAEETAIAHYLYGVALDSPAYGIVELFLSNVDWREIAEAHNEHRGA